MSLRRVSRRARMVAALVVLVVALAAGPADGQEAPTTVPAAPASPASPIGDGLEGDGGSPLVFVVLSLAGGTVALAIMAVQWVRTRPSGHGSA